MIAVDTPAKRREKYFALLKVGTINSEDPEKSKTKYSLTT